jgi:hypothetical protein
MATVAVVCPFCELAKSVGAGLCAICSPAERQKVDVQAASGALKVWARSLKRSDGLCDLCWRRPLADPSLTRKCSDCATEYTVCHHCFPAPVAACRRCVQQLAAEDRCVCCESKSVARAPLRKCCCGSLQTRIVCGRCVEAGGKFHCSDTRCRETEVSCHNCSTPIAKQPRDEGNRFSVISAKVRCADCGGYEAHILCGVCSRSLNEWTLKVPCKCVNKRSSLESWV